MIDAKEVLHWFVRFLIKNLLVVLQKVQLGQTNNYQMNCTNQLLEILRNIKYIAGLT